MDFPLPLQKLPKRSSLGFCGPVKWNGELSYFGLGKFQLEEMALPTWKNGPVSQRACPNPSWVKLDTSSLDCTLHLLWLHNAHLACREWFQLPLLEGLVSKHAWHFAKASFCQSFLQLLTSTLFANMSFAGSSGPHENSVRCGKFYAMRVAVDPNGITTYNVLQFLTLHHHQRVYAESSQVDDP